MEQVRRAISFSLQHLELQSGPHVYAEFNSSLGVNLLSKVWCCKQTNSTDHRHSLYGHILTHKLPEHLNQ